MRILLMTAHAYFPQQAGGIEAVTQQLAQALAKRGHETAVATELSFRNKMGAAYALQLAWQGTGYVLDRYDGQAVYRVRKIVAHARLALDEFRPDCVIVQSTDAMPLAEAVNERRIPLVVYWHDVFTDRNCRPNGLSARFCANSNFTASVYENLFGVKAAVIPPLIDRTRYETNRAGARCVTFVNPHPDKGAVLATEIAARCPEISFEFVESWMLDRTTRRWLFRRLSDLSNVRFTTRQSDMRPIYAQTYILLVPSQCAEGWGRVASEAHISGIPVVGSRLGGLIEAIGPGGLLIDPSAPAEVWCEALRGLWHDKWRHAELSEAAQRHSKRDDVRESVLVDRTLVEIDAAIALHNPAADWTMDAAPAREYSRG